MASTAISRSSSSLDPDAILLAVVLVADGFPFGQFFFLQNQNPQGHSLTQQITK
jgi:hypothetical protein